MNFIAKHKKLIQLGLELLIPIIGVLSGWDYALLIFYFILDFVAKGVVVLLKWRKLKQEKRVSVKMNKAEFPWMILWSGMLLGVLLFLVLLVDKDLPIGEKFANIGDLFNTMIDSAGKEIWLLPLIGLGAYGNYYMEFVRGMEYRVCEVKGFFTRRCIELMPILIWTAALIMMQVDEDLIILAIALIKGGAEYLLLRKETFLMNKNLTKGY